MEEIPIFEPMRERVLLFHLAFLSPSDGYLFCHICTGQAFRGVILQTILGGGGLHIRAQRRGQRTSLVESSTYIIIPSVITSFYSSSCSEFLPGSNHSDLDTRHKTCRALVEIW